MGAPTQYYVDLSVASDGGDGLTSGTPLTRADGSAFNAMLAAITRDSTNGDVINVAGVAHTSVTYNADIVSYGIPTASAPLWVLLESDAEIIGSGSLFNASRNCVHIRGGKITGVNIVVLSASSVVCTEVTATSGNAIYTQGHVCGCKVNVSGSAIGIYSAGTAVITGNWVNLAASSTGKGIDADGGGTVVSHNKVTGGTGSWTGIRLTRINCLAEQNSVYASGGASSTGIGIHCDDTSQFLSVSKNLIEGFGGGTGIRTVTNVNKASVWANSMYNCGTATSLSAENWLLVDDYKNETLGSSPFTDASGGDFTPVDVGLVLSAFGDLVTDILPYRGAIPPASGGGGVKFDPLGRGALVI